MISGLELQQRVMSWSVILRQLGSVLMSVSFITRGHGRADSSSLGTRESLQAASLGELPPSQENMFEQWSCLSKCLWGRHNLMGRERSFLEHIL